MSDFAQKQPWEQRQELAEAAERSRLERTAPGREPSRSELAKRMDRAEDLLIGIDGAVTKWETETCYVLTSEPHAVVSESEALLLNKKRELENLFGPKFEALVAAGIAVWNSKPRHYSAVATHKSFWRGVFDSDPVARKQFFSRLREN